MPSRYLVVNQTSSRAYLTPGWIGMRELETGIEKNLMLKASPISPGDKAGVRCPFFQGVFHALFET